MSLFKNRLRVKSTSTTIGHFLYLHEEGSLFLDAEYQRDYVWQEEHQQALLKSVFVNQPINSVAVVINEASIDKYCEGVDGKQRLTTLIKFATGEIPYILDDGSEMFFDDMENPDKIQFRQTRLTSNELHTLDGSPVTEADKIKYFLHTNFGGVPQSDEHRAVVEEMFVKASS